MRVERIQYGSGRVFGQRSRGSAASTIVHLDLRRKKSPATAGCILRDGCISGNPERESESAHYIYIMRHRI